MFIFIPLTRAQTFSIFLVVLSAKMGTPQIKKQERKMKIGASKREKISIITVTDEEEIERREREIEEKS